MMKWFSGFIALAVICQIGASWALADQQFKARVRRPVVAGQFYPADPSKLARSIDYFLKDAVEPLAQRPMAVISPHAGYVYSGQICADAFKQAAGHEYDLIVLLGTNHTSPGFTGVSIYPKGGYETPLGIAKIDDGLAARLMAADKDFTFRESVHAREHSIEVLVPFVQRLFPEAKILAAVIGQPDLDLCLRFGRALAKEVQGRRVLIVASSDFSHYPAYDDAVRVDKKTLEAIVTLNPAAVQSVLKTQMQSGIPNLHTCACGEAPILAAMAAATNLGANLGRIISYANSGDASIGSRSRVVGYGAIAFFSEKPGPKNDPGKNPQADTGINELAVRHKTALLSFARKTMRQILVAQTFPLARGFDPVLEQRQGAFVTLKKHGQLRGCIGHMTDDLPLCQVVGAMALQAAFNDRRFSPVTLKELAEIEIEISVLTPFKPVDKATDIQVGRDGVVLRKETRSAVFLPQVAVEQGWDRNEMLDRLCLKAGLPRGGWKKSAELFTFQAIVFSESDFK